MSAVSVVAREGNRFSPWLELELQGGLWGCELPDTGVGYQVQGLWKSSNSVLAAEPPLQSHDDRVLNHSLALN